MRKKINSLTVTVFIFAFSVGSAMAGPITFSDETTSAGVFGRKRGIGFWIEKRWTSNFQHRRLNEKKKAEDRRQRLNSSQ